MTDQELVNRPLVKAWVWSSLIWLTVFPIQHKRLLPYPGFGCTGLQSGRR